MEEGSSSKKPLGCDPNSSLLFAQVISGEPKMIIDEEGFLRTTNLHSKKNKIFFIVICFNHKLNLFSIR